MDTDKQKLRQLVTHKFELQTQLRIEFDQYLSGLNFIKLNSMSLSSDIIFNCRIGLQQFTIKANWNHKPVGTFSWMHAKSPMFFIDLPQTCSESKLVHDQSRALFTYLTRKASTIITSDLPSSAEYQQTLRDIELTSQLVESSKTKQYRGIVEDIHSGIEKHGYTTHDHSLEEINRLWLSNEPTIRYFSFVRTDLTIQRNAVRNIEVCYENNIYTGKRLMIDGMALDKFEFDRLVNTHAIIPFSTRVYEFMDNYAAEIERVNCC